MLGAGVKATTLKFWMSGLIRTVNETRGESIGPGTRRAQGKQGRNQERAMGTKVEGGGWCCSEIGGKE